MDYKNSRMIGDDCIRIPFNCDQGFEEYYLVFVGKSPFEHERHLDKVVCSRGPLSAKDHDKCKVTDKDLCWKDNSKNLKQVSDKPKTTKKIAAKTTPKAAAKTVTKTTKSKKTKK